MGLVHKGLLVRCFLQCFCDCSVIIVLTKACSWWLTEFLFFYLTCFFNGILHLNRQWKRHVNNLWSLILGKAVMGPTIPDAFIRTESCTWSSPIVFFIIWAGLRQRHRSRSLCCLLTKVPLEPLAIQIWFPDDIFEMKQYCIMELVLELERCVIYSIYIAQKTRSRYQESVACTDRYSQVFWINRDLSMFGSTLTRKEHVLFFFLAMRMPQSFFQVLKLCCTPILSLPNFLATSHKRVRVAFHWEVVKTNAEVKHPRGQAGEISHIGYLEEERLA